MITEIITNSILKKSKNFTHISKMFHLRPIFKYSYGRKLLLQLASLLQWFDKVINDTILKDLDKADNEVHIFAEVQFAYIFFFRALNWFI